MPIRIAHLVHQSAHESRYHPIASHTPGITNEEQNERKSNKHLLCPSRSFSDKETQEQ
jgi:hypothetical protein